MTDVMAAIPGAAVVQPLAIQISRADAIGSTARTRGEYYDVKVNTRAGNSAPSSRVRQSVRMRAALFVEPQQDLSLEDVTALPPGDRDVVVALLASGVCH